MRSVIFKNKSYLFVLFLERYDFLNHFFVDDCNCYWVFSISEIIFQVKCIGIILDKNIVFICNIFYLIFFWVFDDQNDKITIKSLFDFFNLLISKKFNILGSNVRMYVKFSDLILFDLFSSNWWFGLLSFEI